MALALAVAGWMLVGWAAIAVLSYALLFRKAYNGDRLILTVLWPWTLPAAAIYWRRYKQRRANLPMVIVRKAAHP